MDGIHMIWRKRVFVCFGYHLDQYYNVCSGVTLSFLTMYQTAILFEATIFTSHYNLVRIVWFLSW